MEYHLETRTPIAGIPQGASEEGLHVHILEEGPLRATLEVSGKKDQSGYFIFLFFLVRFLWRLVP